MTGPNVAPVFAATRWRNQTVNRMTRLDPKTLMIAAACAALVLPLVQGSSDGTSNAANKTAAGSSSFVYLGNAATPLPPTTIIDTYIKTGGPQDALIQVSMECSLVTDVYSTTVDNHPEGYTAIGEAEAHVVAWVLVDGTPVTLGGADQDGRITFCDRVHQQEIRDIDSSTGNFTIRQLQKTMSANSFDFVALDLGSGVHHVEVVATVTAANTQGSYAEGAIGKRMLVVEPVSFAHGATVTNSDASLGLPVA